jgi:archaellum component FlaC
LLRNEVESLARELHGAKGAEEQEVKRKLKEVEKAINSLKRKLASLEKQRIELKKKSRLGE